MAKNATFSKIFRQNRFSPENSALLLSTTVQSLQLNVSRARSLNVNRVEGDPVDPQVAKVENPTKKDSK